MTNVVAKHGLLFGIAIFINPWYLIVIVLCTFKFVTDGFYSNFALLSIPSTQTLECTVNVIVSWLVLRINYDKYIYLCKSCHICMIRCCFKDMNINMKKSVDNPYDLLDKRYGQELSVTASGGGVRKTPKPSSSPSKGYDSLE